MSTNCLYRRACAHSDRTIAELALAETGHVPWWLTAEQHPTLHTLMVTVVVETSRHAGHADVLRELIDGRVGMRAGQTNMPAFDAAWWESHHQRLQTSRPGWTDDQDEPIPQSRQWRASLGGGAREDDTDHAPPARPQAECSICG